MCGRPILGQDWHLGICFFAGFGWITGAIPLTGQGSVNSSLLKRQINRNDKSLANQGSGDIALGGDTELLDNG